MLKPGQWDIPRDPAQDIHGLSITHRAAAGTDAAKWDPQLSRVAVGPRNPCSERLSEQLAPQV